MRNPSRRPALVSLLLLASLATGCAEVSRELTISEVTSAELQSVLVQPVDLPGWTSEEVQPVAGTERVQNRFEEEVTSDGSYICDLEPVTGSLYTSPEETRTVVSQAERICGASSDVLEYTISKEAAYREAERAQLTANLASAGVSVTDYESSRVELGLGSDVIAYQTAALLQGAEQSLEYQSFTVTIFGEKVATTLFFEGYGVPVDADDLERLVSLVRARQANL